jgi:integral membrane sensor domain MASE1
VRKSVKPVSLVAAIYAIAVGGYLLTHLFYDPRAGGCYWCQRNLLLVHASHTALTVTPRLTAALALAVTVAIVLRLGWRWWRASAPGRRALTPIICAAPVVAAVVAATLIRNDFGVAALFSFGGGDTLLEWSVLVYVAVPLAFLAGLLRTRLHRTALGSLVVELS